MPKKKTKSNPEQGMFFEDHYLMRIHRQLTSSSDMAFAELVANAWDAGAFKVDISISGKKDNEKRIVIEDDGIGMTEQEFNECWKTLAYDRLKRRGSQVVFPSDSTKGLHRIAFGRNGIGRHGLLCFGDSYTIISKSSETSEEIGFRISLGTGEYPLVFEKIDVTEPLIGKHGTRLTVQVERNSPRSKSILRSLSTRFLYDPQFSISVNGESASLEDLSRRLEKQEFQVGDMAFEMFILYSLTSEPGIAFWQGGRLVGQPSWILGNESIADKRTKAGRDYSVIVKTNDIGDFVQEDWSGFRRERIEELQPVFDAVTERYIDYCRQINKENYTSTRDELKAEFSAELQTSSTLVKYEFEEAISVILETHPTASKPTIKAALETVLQLGRKRGGVELLQKLSDMDGESVENLNAVLEEWTVRDICVVLDEIDRRIRTVDAIAKLAPDKATPELSILHPLVTEARWLFGPEFDSPEYTSNQWLSTTAKKIFKNQVDVSKLTVPQKRADLVILEDYTISLTGTDHFDSEYGSLSLTDRILLIELKKGGSEINREERSQLVEYVEEIYAVSSHKGISITAFVVGDSIGQNITDQKICDDNAKIYVRTYSHLVDSARKRLFRLRSSLHEHYDNLPDSKLYQGLLPNFDR